MIEHDYCCHSMRYWRLESRLCGEDGIAMHCVVVSHHLCELLNICEAYHPSLRKPTNHRLFKKTNINIIKATNWTNSPQLRHSFIIIRYMYVTLRIKPQHFCVFPIPDRNQPDFLIPTFPTFGVYLKQSVGMAL